MSCCLELKTAQRWPVAHGSLSQSATLSYSSRPWQPCMRRHPAYAHAGLPSPPPPSLPPSLQVCARAGLPLQAAVLEGGRYLVLWPADSAVRLAVAGERFVIDPYAGGELYSMEEVRRLALT